MSRILCIEDNIDDQILISTSLEEHEVQFVTSAQKSYQAIEKGDYDLILIDLNLPDGDGIGLLSEFTQNPNTRSIPMFILTAKADISSKLVAFSIGAEDYITKPVPRLELRARVNAKLRKVLDQNKGAEIIKLHDLVINLPTQRVGIQSEEGLQTVSLTSKEFRLLVKLARFPERIFTREQLLDSIWGGDVYITNRTVDSHMGHLRRKIKSSKVKIETVVNEGYRLSCP